MKVRYVVIGVIIAVILLVGAFSGGFITSRLISPQQANISMLQGGINAIQQGDTTPGAAGSSPDLNELFAPFWQAWDLVHEQYVQQPVDNEILMRGAIRGMLDALGDPHTSYLDPEEYKTLNTSLQGEETYEGIGAWVDTSGDYLMVISPMPGSPAENADLHTGDKIIAIDDEDMTGVDGEVVRKKVLGPAGSTVKLTIAREGIDPFDVNIVRKSITVPSIESRMLDDNIAYVRLFIFSDTVGDELHDTLKKMLAQNPNGVILDLRGNGGGYLDSAVDVVSEFVDQGVVMYEEYGDGTRKPLEAHKGGVATGIPLVVLVNEGSASASEITAGAIQDTQRGKLVGVTTYGKGSVQMPSTLKNNEGAVRITIARWLTPNGRTIHGVGLTPDFEVPITQDDITANRDPQLDKAIEVLKSLIQAK
jgi:carboxyl-terminal processing protease